MSRAPMLDDLQSGKVKTIVVIYYNKERTLEGIELKESR
jgi:hypothetical protein